MAEQIANSAQSTLAAGITNSQSTLVVQSAAGFPTLGNFRLQVDAEIMLVTAVSSTTFTITRAVEGTSAASHLAGSFATLIVTAASIIALITDRVGTLGSITPAASNPGDTAINGGSGVAADASHRHAREAFGSVISQRVFGLGSSSGSAASIPRSDHKHGTPYLSPINGQYVTLWPLAVPSAPTVVATSALAAPAAPSLVTSGTPGATSYSYYVVAVDANGDTFPSPVTTIATGAATLTGVNYIQVSWLAITGATSYKVIRSASGGTPSSTGIIASGVTGLSFSDTGIAASAYTPQGLTSYSYYVVAVSVDGDGIPSPVTTIANGFSALSAGRYNAISWAFVDGASSYKILKGSTGQVLATGITLLAYNDIGGTTSAYTPSTLNPGGSIFAQYYSINIQGVAYAASITPDITNGSFFVITLTGNITVANALHPGTGQEMTFEFIQDGTGGRTVAWGTSYKVNWTPTTSPGLRNIISFVHDGSAWIQISSAIGIPS